jgi:peptidoglycan/xylan/chitin deacetylase (PgdA/CDA1 family)
MSMRKQVHTKKAESATLLVFWDYDTQWGGDRSRSPGGRKSWGYQEFENTERLLELHARYEVPACFAVVGSAALPGSRPYHDPEQIRRIHAAGHEIASHSHRHEWLPGLDRRALRETLSASKDALEQCIGAPVVSFVPPYNQPFDYPRGWSFSLSERQECGANRTDLLRLCETLQACGYRFNRICYRPLTDRLLDRLVGRPVERPSWPERIAHVTCIRLNTPGGFDDPARAMARQCAARGGWIVVYGHPHSLTAGNSQDERYLLPFLQLVSRLRDAGVMSVRLPRDLVAS